MQMKDFMQDNGYKSRKFLMILLTILMVATLGVVWSWFGWNTVVLTSVMDNISTLVLGYCGISAARATIPAASIAYAKIKQNNTTTQSTINAKENLAGAKDSL